MIPDCNAVTVSIPMGDFGRTYGMSSGSSHLLSLGRMKQLPCCDFSILKHLEYRFENYQLAAVIEISSA
jgi:hypothetical protein